MYYRHIGFLLICFSFPRTHPCLFKVSQLLFQNQILDGRCWDSLLFLKIAFLIWPWLPTVLPWLSVWLHNANSAVNGFLTGKYNILMSVGFVAKKVICVWDRLLLNSWAIWPRVLKDHSKYPFKIITTMKTVLPQRQSWAEGKESPKPDQCPSPAFPWREGTKAGFGMSHGQETEGWWPADPLPFLPSFLWAASAWFQGQLKEELALAGQGWCPDLDDFCSCEKDKHQHEWTCPHQVLNTTLSPLKLQCSKLNTVSSQHLSKEFSEIIFWGSELNFSYHDAEKFLPQETLWCL